MKVQGPRRLLNSPTSKVLPPLPANFRFITWVITGNAECRKPEQTNAKAGQIEKWPKIIVKSEPNPEKKAAKKANRNPNLSNKFPRQNDPNMPPKATEGVNSSNHEE